MSEFITKFNSTGECEIDVEKVAEAWDDEFWLITQNHTDYRLFNTDVGLKVEISKQQAHELIGKLDLVDTQSPVFRMARTWRKTYGER